MQRAVIVSTTKRLRARGDETFLISQSLILAGWRER